MSKTLDFEVRTKLNQADFQKLESSLRKLSNMSMQDIMKVNTSDLTKAQDDLKDIHNTAQLVEASLHKAFNTKLNTVNLQTFNNELTKSGLTIDKIAIDFNKAGTSGQSAFRSLANTISTTNLELKQSHQLLDKMANTLGNTLKWNLASGAVNTLTNSVT